MANGGKTNIHSINLAKYISVADFEITSGLTTKKPDSLGNESGKNSASSIHESLSSLSMALHRTAIRSISQAC